MANHWAHRLEGWRIGGSVLRRIVASTTVVTLTTVAVKAVSLAKDMVVAHRYGAGDALDAYFYVVAYLGFVGAVVIGSFEVSFLPVYIRTREEQGAAAAQRLVGDAATLLSVLLLGALVAFVAVSRQALPYLVAGFGPDKIRLTQALMVWLIPFLWWHALFVLYRAVLISSERFLLGAAAPAWLSIGLLLFVGCGGSHWGAGALVAGTLGGYLAQLMTAAVGLRRAGVSPRLTWHGLTPELRQILTQSAPMAGAMLISAASPIVDQSLAASFPAGSVAVLGYGYKLTALVLGLTEGLHLGVFPYLAQMVARREVAALSRT